jgi:uncharacterized protein (DUF736 family)
MQIGYVTEEVLMNGEQETRWLKLHIRIPFLRHAEFKLAKNTKKVKENEPDYIIYMFVNGRGETFRTPKVGALWLKKSTKTGEPYLGGQIDSPVLPSGKMYIVLTKAKPLYEDEKVTWLYDALWSVPDSAKTSSEQKESMQYSYDTGEMQTAYTGEEIPF